MTTKTIDGFEKMTKQELFDMSARHVTKTKTYSMDGSGEVCLYGGKIGCGASIFLKESFRVKADGFNNTKWDQLPKISRHESDFIMELQNCHDSSAFETVRNNTVNFLVQWKSRMLKVAEEHDISTDVLHTLTAAI